MENDDLNSETNLNLIGSPNVIIIPLTQESEAVESSGSHTGSTATNIPVQLRFNPYPWMMEQLETLFTSTGKEELFRQIKMLLNMINNDDLKVQMVLILHKLYINREKKEESVKSLTCEMVRMVEECEKQESHFFNFFCLMELNYLTLLNICRDFNKKLQTEVIEQLDLLQKTYKMSQEELEFKEDLLSLDFLNEFIRESPLVDLVSYIVSFNSKMKIKDFFLKLHVLDSECSKFTQQKTFISNFEAVLNPVFLAMKYVERNPVTEDIEEKFKIDIKFLIDQMRFVFNVTFEYILMHYKLYENTINDKITNFKNFEHFLSFTWLITDYVNEFKLREKDDDSADLAVDFSTFFPAFNDCFTPFYFNSVKTKVISITQDFLYFTENKSLNFNQVCKIVKFSPFILKFSNSVVEEFIVHHFSSSLINDNSYEAISRNLWLKAVIEYYCFADFMCGLYSVIYKYSKKQDFRVQNGGSNISLTSGETSSEKEMKEEIISFIVEKLNKNFRSLLPRKLILLKELYTLNYLCILNNLLLKCPSYSFILEKKEEVISFLEEMKKFQNKYYFILCCNILKLIMKEKYTYQLRIYGFHAFPLDYYQIKEEIETEGENNLSNVNLKTNTDYTESYISLLESSSNLGQKISNMGRDIEIIDLSEVNNENLDCNSEVFVEKERDNKRVTNKKKINSKRRITPSKVNKNSASSTTLNKAVIFDITPIVQNFDPKQFKQLEVKTAKKVIFKQVNGKSLIEFPEKSPYSSCFILVQKENTIELLDFMNFNSSYPTKNPNALSSNFLKEILSLELISKSDLEYFLLISMPSELSSPQENLPNDFKDNSVLNYFNTFKFYDLKESLDYDSIVDGIYNLLD